MFRLALGAVRAQIPDARIICIVLAEHQRQANIAGQLAKAEPTASVVAVPERTGGALQTCLASEDAVGDPTAPLIVLDCDLTFTAPLYFERLLALRAGGGNDGLLLSFRSHEPRYSYAALADDGVHVVRTVEKQPISDRALIGAYGFGSAAHFFACARHIVDANIRTGNGEFYVSSAYNYLIAQGGRVTIVDADAYWSMGTPAELQSCLADEAFLRHAACLRARMGGDSLPRPAAPAA